MDLSLSQDYKSMVLEKIPVLDVRSEGEFAAGAVSAATNFPILSDVERAAVGTTYKQQGPDAAYAKGINLVSGKIKEGRIQQWVKFLGRNPNAVVCCWRGGQRSAIAQRWLAERGHQVPRVHGGSKALRQYCLDQFERLQDRKFLILAGQTGAGKTKLLNRYKPSIDLEGLANHRGSAFGSTGSEQPTPITFEASLTRELLSTDEFALTLLEDESRTIGRLGVPMGLHREMQSSPLVLIEKSLEDRVELTYESYVSSQNGPELLEALGKIQKRLGGDRYRELRAILAEAIDLNSKSTHCKWIEKLLVYYYDPQYNYQLSKKEERIVFRGDEAAVCAYLYSKHGLESEL